MPDLLNAIGSFFYGLWQALLLNIDKTFIRESRYLIFLEGLKNTLIVSVVAAIIGVVVGVVVAIIKVNYTQTGKLKPLNMLCSAYVSLIRGTPLAIQLLIMTYVIMSSNNNYVLTACVAFGLNSGAYVSEVIRAGIMAVDVGQMEAARSLGLPRLRAMWYIILPQAVKNILPALCNEFIAIIKETSILGLIAVVDLTRASDVVRSRTYEAFFPLFSVALVYYLMVAGLAKIVSIFEKRLARSDRS